eukprot:7442238-Pyramimonas_sp.AAC.1
MQYGATVQAIVDAGTTPHIPVKLTLCSATLMDFGYRVARIPKRFPVDIPMGCRTRDPAQLWIDAELDMMETTVDGKWRRWVAAAELD